MTNSNSTEASPRETILQAQQDLHREAASAIAQCTINQILVNTTRQKTNPHLKELENVSGDQMPTSSTTNSAERFLFHDSGNDDENRLLLFATLLALDLLLESEDLVLRWYLLSITFTLSVTNTGGQTTDRQLLGR